MGRLRLELRTNRLKAECSTTELATRLLRRFDEPHNVYYSNALRKKMQGFLVLFEHPVAPQKNPIAPTHS